MSLLTLVAMTSGSSGSITDAWRNITGGHNRQLLITLEQEQLSGFKSQSVWEKWARGNPKEFHTGFGLSLPHFSVSHLVSWVHLYIRVAFKTHRTNLNFYCPLGQWDLKLKNKTKTKNTRNAIYFSSPVCNHIWWDFGWVHVQFQIHFEKQIERKNTGQ